MPRRVIALAAKAPRNPQHTQECRYVAGDLVSHLGYPTIAPVCALIVIIIPVSSNLGGNRHSMDDSSALFSPQLYGVFSILRALPDISYPLLLSRECYLSIYIDYLVEMKGNIKPEIRHLFLVNIEFVTKMLFLHYLSWCLFRLNFPLVMQASKQS